MTDLELDEALYQVQQLALALKMIPIAGVMSRPVSDGRSELLGYGWNRLRDGIPGWHGETGGIVSMGRIPGGYANVVARSTLSPCPFCQGCLPRQMGIKDVIILNGTDDYLPDQNAYRAAGMSPTVRRHEGIERIFADWVRDPKNDRLWKRDIGLTDDPRGLPFMPSQSLDWQPYVERATRLAWEAFDAGECPIGALVVDEYGEVAATGNSEIIRANDPTKTAAVAAWRNRGSDNDWSRYTLVLSAGADHIAYSMFKIFRFGQLVVGSTSIYPGQTEAVKNLSHANSQIQAPGFAPGQTPVHVLQDRRCDTPLREWLQRGTTTLELAREYLGADFLMPRELAA